MRAVSGGTNHTKHNDKILNNINFVFFFSSLNRWQQLFTYYYCSCFCCFVIAGKHGFVNLLALADSRQFQYSHWWIVRYRNNALLFNVWLRFIIISVCFSSTRMPIFVRNNVPHWDRWKTVCCCRGRKRGKTIVANGKNKTPHIPHLKSTTNMLTIDF